MVLIKRLFNFYLAGSLHVALSVYALIRMTQLQLALPDNPNVAWFGFFGTVTGYNFVKYDDLFRVRHSQRREVRGYALLSLVCCVLAGIFFLRFRLITQFLSVVVLALTALYTLPFFPNRRNARNWAGVKIYIVTLCWVAVTVLLPVIDAGHAIGADVLLKCLQRFILVFVLVLIFEIIDLRLDDPHLQTVPQKIGAKRTRALGYALTFLWLAMAFYGDAASPVLLRADGIVAVLLALFLYFASEERSRYYTLFWVESVPVIWWLVAGGLRI